MEINIDLTREDYADFNKFWFIKKGLKKRVYTVIIAAFGLPLLVDNEIPFTVVTYLISVIVFGLIFGLIYLGGTAITIKRTSKLPSGNGSILGKKKYTITEDGFIEESENSKNIQKWEGIKSVETNRNSVFLFVDNIAAYIIPKRFFSDEEEMNNFIKIIDHKLKNSR